MIGPILARRDPRVLWTLAMVILAGGACSGDEQSTLDEIASMSEDEVAERAREMKDLSDVEACELLTAEEIEAATGLTPGTPEDISQVQGQLPMCNWSSADGSGRVITSLLVTRGGYSDYDDFVETTRSQMSDMGVEFNVEDWQHVTDVGDFGVWLGEEAGMLQVYDEGLMVQVSAQTDGSTDKLAASKELATKAFDRL